MPPAEDPFDAICKALGYEFNDRKLLQAALTHRSFTSEFSSSRQARKQATPRGDDNERLEFLGDAVLDFVVADLLWRREDRAAEGQLSRLRAAVVSEPSLAEAALSVGIGQGLRVGRGEERAGGRNRPSLLADALEAVFAAVYLDGGFDVARQVITRVMSVRVDAALEQGLDDAKSTLQEIVQGRWRITPRYVLVSSNGPSHDRKHEVELRAGDIVTSRGVGRARKDAEQSAARAALTELAQRGITDPGAPEARTTLDNVRLGAGNTEDA